MEKFWRMEVPRVTGAKPMHFVWVGCDGGVGADCSCSSRRGAQRVAAFRSLPVVTSTSRRAGVVRKLLVIGIPAAIRGCYAGLVLRAEQARKKRPNRSY